MNDFLNDVYFSNSVRQYLLVAAIILFVFLAKKYIAHSVAGLLFRFIRSRWKTIDSATFKRLIAKPLGLFMAVLVSIIALDKLTFPPELNFKIYRISVHDALDALGTAAIIVTFFLFLIKLTDFIGLVLRDRYMSDGDRARNQLLFFFKDLIKVFLGAVAGLLILKYCFSYDIKGLVTGLSIVGAAVALALKENLENLIASFIIFFDKPFTAGDLVKVNNITGTVEKIGLRSTRIRSDDKTYITVPNKQMSDSVLDNLSDRSQRRAVLKLELEVHTGPQKIHQLIDGLNSLVKKSDIQNSSVFVTDITSTAIVVNVEFYTGPVNINVFNNLRQTVYLQALELLEKLEIEIAGRFTDVNITTKEPVSPPTKIL